MQSDCQATSIPGHAEEYSATLRLVHQKASVRKLRRRVVFAVGHGFLECFHRSVSVRGLCGLAGVRISKSRHVATHEPIIVAE